VVSTTGKNEEALMTLTSDPRSAIRVGIGRKDLTIVGLTTRSVSLAGGDSAPEHVP